MRKKIRKHGAPKPLSRRAGLPRSERHFKASCLQCQHVAAMKLSKLAELGGQTIPLPSPFDPRWRILKVRS